MERRISGDWLVSIVLWESNILESVFLLEEKALFLEEKVLLLEKSAAEVEKSRGQAAVPFASDSAAKKWAEEWSR